MGCELNIDGLWIIMLRSCTWSLSRTLYDSYSIKELYRTEQNRIFILFKHIQLITITKLQNAWIIKYTYTV